MMLDRRERLDAFVTSVRATSTEELSDMTSFLEGLTSPGCWSTEQRAVLERLAAFLRTELTCRAALAQLSEGDL